MLHWYVVEPAMAAPLKEEPQYTSYVFNSMTKDVPPEVDEDGDALPIEWRRSVELPNTTVTCVRFTAPMTWSEAKDILGRKGKVTSLRVPGFTECDGVLAEVIADTLQILKERGALREIKGTKFGTQSAPVLSASKKTWKMK